MPVSGYIVIEGEKWTVTLSEIKTRRAIKHRHKGDEGVHLEEVQTFLEQPRYGWLLDALRHGTTVYLPR